MASITMKRGTLSEINATPISDGQVLWTTNQTYNKIYADVGTSRIQIGGQQTVDTTLNTGSSNPIANSAVATAINTINTSLSYNSGDTYTTVSSAPYCGILVAGATTISFAVIVPKSLKNITNFNFSAPSLSARLPTGGFLFQNVDASTYFSSVSIAKSANDDIMRVNLVKSGGYPGGINDSMVAVNGSMTFTFS